MLIAYKNEAQTGLLAVIVAVGLVLGGCSQPADLPASSPTFVASYRVEAACSMGEWVGFTTIATEDVVEYRTPDDGPVRNALTMPELRIAVDIDRVDRTSESSGHNHRARVSIKTSDVPGGTHSVRPADYDFHLSELLRIDFDGPTLSNIAVSTEMTDRERTHIFFLGQPSTHVQMVTIDELSGLRASTWFRQCDVYISDRQPL